MGTVDALWRQRRVTTVGNFPIEQVRVGFSVMTNSRSIQIPN